MGLPIRRISSQESTGASISDAGQYKRSKANRFHKHNLSALHIIPESFCRKALLIHMYGLRLTVFHPRLL
jgi:hypothetical protein